MCKIEAKLFENSNEHSPMTTAMRTMNIYRGKTRKKTVREEKHSTNMDTKKKRVLIKKM